jgi:hypothetical protein
MTTTNTNTKNTKLATFRIDQLLWDQFLAKTKASRHTATTVLLNAVHLYLDLESHSPAIAAEAIALDPPNIPAKQRR